MQLIASAEWGGRAAGADRVADALTTLLEGFPVIVEESGDGWFEPRTAQPLPRDRGGLIAWIEQHRERDGGGAVQPLAGFSFAVARGTDGPATGDAHPFASISAMVGVAVGGPRLAANKVSVSASAGWLASAAGADRVAVVGALADAWSPAWAVAYDRETLRGLPRGLSLRTPWPGYVTYFADGLVPKVELPASFAVTPRASGRLAVLDEPWHPTRVLEGIEVFLRDAIYSEIPEREPDPVER